MEMNPPWRVLIPFAEVAGARLLAGTLEKTFVALVRPVLGRLARIRTRTWLTAPCIPRWRAHDGRRGSGRNDLFAIARHSAALVGMMLMVPGKADIRPHGKERDPGQ